MTPRDPQGPVTGPDDPRLTAWALGEADTLDPEARRAIAAALANDAAVAAEIDAIRGLDAALSDAFGQAPGESLTEEQRAAILTPPVAAAPVIALAPRRRWALAVGVAALAAAAAVAFVVLPGDETAPADVGTQAAVAPELEPKTQPAAAPASEVAATSSPNGSAVTEVMAVREEAGVATGRAKPAEDAAGATATSVAVPVGAPPVDALKYARVADANEPLENRNAQLDAARVQAQLAHAAAGSESEAPDVPRKATMSGASAYKYASNANVLSALRKDAKALGDVADGSAAIAGGALAGEMFGDTDAPSIAQGYGRAGPMKPDGAAVAPSGDEALRLRRSGATGVVGGAHGVDRAKGQPEGALRGLGGLAGGFITADGFYVTTTPAGVAYYVDHYGVHRPYPYPVYVPQPRAPAVPWPFTNTRQKPLSTFSIDVDTASLSHARRYLLNKRRVPNHLVRVEEIVNAFDYGDPAPEGDDAVGVKVEVASAPWAPENTLVRVALSTRPVANGDRPPANLVFLVDTSGSMKHKSKLPLLVKALTRLVDNLRDDDRVAIVTYASRARVALKSTAAAERGKILRALRRLKAGGYTNGGAGLDKAYELAQQGFVRGGSNRVVLATDGEFNSGQTGHWQLQQLIKSKARSGVLLSVLGFGHRGYDDQRLETLSKHGDGRYAFIDSLEEAERVLVRELDATLVTAARDVRVQVELNPALARGYRLLGYENRKMAAQQFNQEGTDAGEIGAGESVVAFYEVIPTTLPPAVDTLKYQPPGYVAPNAEAAAAEADETGELMTVKVRWVPVEGGRSLKREVAVPAQVTPRGDLSADYLLSAAAAAFALKLRAWSDPLRRVTWGEIRALVAQASTVFGPSPEHERLLTLVDAAQRVYGGP